jgi:hypothetical protein
MTKFDGILRFRLFLPGEGGRDKGIPSSARFYSCPLFDGSKYWDCRIMLDGRGIELGETYEYPLLFLSPNEATRTIRPDAKVQLWEGRIIGTGTVVELTDSLL